MRRVLPLALCVLLVGLAGPARAQDTSDVAFRVRMPDSIVVTASRRAVPARTTGRRVTVYTQEDLRALSVNSIDQLLDVVAGLDVQSRGGFGVQSDLKLRGSSFNGVLLLLDGARVNDPYTGHFLMDLPVPLWRLPAWRCSASVDAGAVTVGVQGTWQDRLDDPRLATDRYGVLHARLAYETRLAGTRLTLSGELRNVFDRQYSEVFDAPMPGRTLLVGAELQL